MKLICMFVLEVFACCFVYSQDLRGDLSTGDDDFAFSKLPVDVQPDFYTILTGAANAIGGSCLGIEPDYNKVELLLYTNDTNHNTRLDPTNPVGLDFNAPLYLLAHGWLSGVNGYQIKAFRNKYITLYGKNIIFVNWGRLSWYPYTTVYCNIPFMAKHIATFLCKLSEEHHYDLNNVHMIGHSFGAQLAGHTGKIIQKTCNKMMGRITALDPAGPIYQFVSAPNRLAPTDANFVEVIHSQSGTFGYLGKCGTVDYHLNCGSVQPGCSIPQDFVKVLEASIFIAACPHFRAMEIWPYVLDSKEFKGKTCKWCPTFIPGSCITEFFRADFISMGHTYVKPKSEHYNVVTGSAPPFRLGCSPYPFQGCI